MAKELEEAKTKVQVNANYWHHKSREKTYKVIGLGFLEATDKLCVIYQAQYGEKIIFVRLLGVWLENVECEGKAVPRFNKI